MKKFSIIEEDETPFYVMNDFSQFFVGFKLGKGNYEDDFDKARKLYTDSQFKTLQILSDCPIEKIYL